VSYEGERLAELEAAILQLEEGLAAFEAIDMRRWPYRHRWAHDTFLKVRIKGYELHDLANELASDVRGSMPLGL
jgi:hypothetical protein